MSRMGATELVLIRHGEGQYSLDKRVGGPLGCTGLSSLGRLQAAEVAPRLEKLGGDVVLSSILRRAVETAELATAWSGLGVEADCELCEVHVGVADGLPLEEARARYGWPGPWPEPPEGAETVEAFAMRVARAMEALIRRYQGRRVLVFTHGGFIAAACHHLMGLPWRAERDPDHPGFYLDPAHTGITEWSQTRPGSPWVLVRYNDVAHLEGGRGESFEAHRG